MAPSPLTITAKMTAAGRALESRRADRLFEDPLAETLAGRAGFKLMDRWRRSTAGSVEATTGPRTRFFDDLILERAAKGVMQLVLVGAGMDARAFRLRLPPQGVVFELDDGELLAEKQRLLDGCDARPRCRRIDVAADLRDPSWTARLEAAGLQTSRPSTFLLEAFSWCLEEAVLASTLDGLASLGGAGSVLGIDLLSADFLSRPELLPLIAASTELGFYWQFGTNDPAGFLAAHGWRATVSDLSAVSRRLRPAQGASSAGPTQGAPSAAPGQGAPSAAPAHGAPSAAPAQGALSAAQRVEASPSGIYLLTAVLD